MYDLNAYDEFAHAPAHRIMTHLNIDDANFQWYKEKTKKSSDQHYYFPILYSLKRHPKFDKM